MKTQARKADTTVGRSLASDCDFAASRQALPRSFAVCQVTPVTRHSRPTKNGVCSGPLASAHPEAIRVQKGRPNNTRLDGLSDAGQRDGDGVGNFIRRPPCQIRNQIYRLIKFSIIS